MKTKLIRMPLFALALGAFATALCAQNNFRELGAQAPAAAKPAKKDRAAKTTKRTATERISFSDKSRPGTLKINIPTAEIEVQGTDGDEIVVTSSLDKKGAPKVDDEGFRRLDQEVAFELVENNNVATLRISGGNPWFASGAEFEIRVPRNTNLSIKTQSGDGIEIDDVDGDIDISTTSGEIDLENIGGAVVANTMSGRITAEFKRAPKKNVSLTATNGGVTLALPENAAANLRMRTLNGTIRTNFPESALKTASVERTTPETRTVQLRVTSDSPSGMTTVLSSDSGNSYAFSTTENAVSAPASPAPPAPPSDKELVDTIIETRKARVIDYADKGLAAAQKGIAAAMKAIDGISGLSNEEKELIKRKLQSGSNHFPRSLHVGVSGIPPVGGNSISGELNGGGVDIHLTTMNGTITLKQAK